MSEPSPRRQATSPGQEPIARQQAGASKNQPRRPNRADYQHLPLECPNCGFQGRAKIDRLDRTFQCQQCKKLFYVTFDGTVSGERPPEEVQVDLDRLVVAEKPSWLERTLGRLPPWGRWAVAGVLLLALAFAASSLMEPEKPLPGELEDRAALAAKSFSVGDWSTLKRLAAPHTSSSLAEWYDKSRPADWQDLAPGEVSFEIVSLRKGLLGYEKGTPLMDARETAAIRPRGKSLPVLFLWRQTELGEWWLDGERMLREFKPTKKAKTAGDAAE